MKQNAESGVTAYEELSRYTDWRPNLLLREWPQLSSLAAELWIPCCPLLEVGENQVSGKPLETGLDTHKTPLSAQVKRGGWTFFKNRLQAAGSCPFWT